MGDAFIALDALTIAEHGDARERSVWNEVGTTLSNYESFWRSLVTLLTNRIVPDVAAGPEWIRVRPSIPPAYERLAMHNYSLFYYAAMARHSIEEDRNRLTSGAYPHPECVFCAMQSAIEHAKALQIEARTILRDRGVKWKFPKHPDALYQTIGLYRNAFMHDPVLGRAIDHGRELLPPVGRLPNDGTPLLWRDAATIPIDEMVDGLKLENDLWQKLAEFLQDQWKSLADAFVIARKQNKFIDDLGLQALLPIRCTPVAISPSAPIRGIWHNHRSQ